MSRPKIAVIGCGLQAEFNQLPSITGSDLYEVALLVDKDTARAQRLAEKYGIPGVSGDYRDALGRVEAALVALPNYLHAAVASDLLREGVHVLVEKPMARNTSECDRILDAALRGKAIVAVGLDFRFTRAAQLTQQLVAGGLLGEILQFDIRIGSDLTNISFFRSEYLLRKELAGGGVLIDLGIHAVDLILWWLGDYETVDCYDDAQGGVEANCELHLRLRSGASGIIEASRTRDLRNTCIIHGERGTLEVGIWDKLGLLTLKIPNQSVTLMTDESELREPRPDILRRQFTDFLSAARDGREPSITGREGKRSVELIEVCYGSKRALPQPWALPPPRPLKIASRVEP